MIRTLACRLSDTIAEAAGSVWAVYLAIIACVLAWRLYPPTDPFNSLVSDISLVMLFVLTRSGNRGDKASHTKLDTLIHGVPDADDRIAGIERNDDHPGR